MARPVIPHIPLFLPAQTPIFLWDFAAATAAAASGGAPPVRHNLLLHKVSTQALSFSPDGSLLASIGGAEDNTVAVWEVEAGRAVCGTPAGTHAALTLAWFNGRSDRLVTGGQYHMRTWEVDMTRRRMFPSDWKTGSVKRIFTAVVVDDTDTRAFVGTTTGDVLEFNVVSGNFMQASKVRFSLGIHTATFASDASGGTIIAGTGDGALVRLSAKDLTVKAVSELLGAVTSVAVSPGGDHGLAGTDAGSLYAFPIATLVPRLLTTAHHAPIADVVFPAGTSDLFLTASGSDIRLWNARKGAELLRIQVPNLNVLSIAINATGTSIVSGWDDGKIRAFGPESGALQYAIPDAHAEAVTAVAFTHDGSKVVSGGRDGRVRVWSVGGRAQSMLLSFKEHKKEVTSVTVSSNDEEAVTASADGSVLIWSLKRGTRVNAMFASTIFRCALYHPDESQLLTAGSDRKITYWDSTDCTAIRIMEGSTEEVRVHGGFH